MEKLHEILDKNPGGVLVVRDELSGWLATLDKQGREGERAFYLETWNGNSGFTMDRIGRGTVHADYCCVSLLGGIQPARLRSYLADALADGPTNDGLIQRFQIAVWPDVEPKYTLVDRPPDEAARKTASQVFKKLASQPVFNEPTPLKFSAEAQQLFNVWLTDLEHRLRGDELHPALNAHLAKYRSLLPSLALLFELADSAAGLSDGREVSINHTRQAALWCAYLESHANRVYSCMTTPELRGSRELAVRIKQRKLPDVFSARDVHTKGWSGLTDIGVVKGAILSLVEAGWLREKPLDPAEKGGRPTTAYETNPRIFAGDLAAAASA